jgi:hypothetical protein
MPVVQPLQQVFGIIVHSATRGNTRLQPAHTCFNLHHQTPFSALLPPPPPLLLLLLLLLLF